MQERGRSGTSTLGFRPRVHRKCAHRAKEYLAAMGRCPNRNESSFSLKLSLPTLETCFHLLTKTSTG
jgi:hypothetical protein